MEALRRWCHWFVSSHPIKGWTTGTDLGGQVPEVPAEFRILVENMGANTVVPVEWMMVTFLVLGCLWSLSKIREMRYDPVLDRFMDLLTLRDNYQVQSRAQMIQCVLALLASTPH